ncbi:MAG: tetratricopeptide (TPR) repeat protein [Mariniblastus sp.]|jgi:tetratricopeptide (TPR) repeat protein
MLSHQNSGLLDSGTTCVDGFTLPRSTGIWQHALAVIVLSLVCCCTSGISFAQSNARNSAAEKQQRSDDAALLDGLRRRRLFDVAEFYCQQQLASPSVDATRQASLVIQWMKTRTEEAVLATPEKRSSAWQAVGDVSQTFLATHAQHPRRLLIEVQEALAHLAHGRLIRQEIDADMAAATAQADALREIQLARAQLNDLQRKIDRTIPEQLGKTVSVHELTSKQLMNLNNNVQYQLAVCNLNRAQLYSASDRLNRIDALNSVKLRLDEVQRTSSEGQPLWWKTKLGQIQCLRLLENPAAARQLATALAQLDATPSTKLLLLEQLAKTATELGDEVFARKVFTEFESYNARTAQLDLAVQQLAVELALRAETDERKQEWLTYAAQLSKSIDQNYGGYWGRRADLALIAATGLAADGTSAGGSNPTNSNPKWIAKNPDGGSSTNVELDLLIRLADEASRKKRLDDALKAYDRATRLAVSIGDSRNALLTDLRAGLILESQKQHAAAAAKLTGAANRDAQQKLAASTHLRGCWNFAQTVGTDSALRTDYEKLLRSHLATWATAASADQAGIYLGKLLQSNRDYSGAVAVYLNVTPTSPLIESAVTQAIACASSSLAESIRTGRSTQTEAARLITTLANAQSSVAPDTISAYRLELAAAELDLVYGTHRPKPTLAARMAQLSGSQIPDIANTARVLELASVCLENNERSKQLLATISGEEDALTRCERCLAAIASAATASQENALQELRLTVVESALGLPAMQQPASQSKRTRWMFKKSDALTKLKRQSESIAVLTELQQQFPRNASIQMQLARATTAQFEKSNPAQALDKWRRVADRLKPNSPNWFEAKYEVSRLIYESGDHERAAKLLKFIKANPPGWKDSAFEAKFEVLLKAAKSKR